MTRRLLHCILIAAILCCAVQTAKAEAPWWTQEEAELLARMIYAEARGESETGQLAVAQCAMDRLHAGGFGDTLEDVLTARGQFAIADEYSPEHMEIALRALDGEWAIDEAVLYFRVSQSSRDWYGPFIARLGRHCFYGEG